MKKINLKGLEMDCFQETLENGLEVYMLPYENKKNYFISFATRYGSDIVSFTDGKGKKITPPLGVAHFLEHKMFEQESGEDPFSFFSASGTDSNASTSFDNTQYICYGTKEFAKNLRYLLHFVNSPYYTDHNVNKEKGIIAEEIKMYEDMPDFQLEMKLRECIYKKHPRRIDIAGTVDEINKITKEDLYACYSNYYVPNNMFVLIVGNFDKEEALKIIEDELGYKKKSKLPKKEKIEEPLEVYHKEATLKKDIEIPKLAYGLKVSLKGFPITDLELDLYLHMLTTILFGASSEFREKARQEKLLSSMYIDWESVEDKRVFYFMASTNEPEKLKKAIIEEFKKKNISEEAFNRIKKVWIANEVRMIDNINDAVSNLYDDIIKYKEIIPNKIDIIRKLKMKTLKEIIKEIDFNNTSTVIMISNKK